MDLEGKMESMAEWMEGKEEGLKTVIGGDFNGRTGREEGRIREEIEGEGEEERRSRDNRKNKGRAKLVEFIRVRGWSILNENIKGNEEGNWTYTGGRGDSVIDYVLVDKETREEIEYMEVGDAIDSDHHPLVVAWKEGRKKGKDKGNKGKGACRGVWDEEGRMVFRELLGGMEWREEKRMERMEETEQRIREDWWDRECREKGESEKGIKGVEESVMEGGSGSSCKEKGTRGDKELEEGKRRFGKDWKKRVWIFDRLIWAMASRQKLRVRAGKTAWAFEERLGNEVREGRYWEREEERNCRLCGSGVET
ncbi:hypothetical protein ALC57_00472 [Trachymyrmex cornetzi]|uniref:Endonuclease/exonuclease/phosphatase domain-containing protein n=1 Tax=Trachymyrmex cornetzi TaxID=471704 RepID=A0A151JS92_9HYME|nr:hypothetical protein ALC57_00472 [Trachymyrmex cornetzi]